jgi:hypothetical protein
LEKAARAIRARFVTAIIRSLLGFSAGGISVAIVDALGPGVGCGASLAIGPAAYMLSVLLASKLYGNLLTRRQLYTVGLLPFLAGWGVGFIFFSQA